MNTNSVINIPLTTSDENGNLNKEEVLIWKGESSQIVNFGHHFICIFIIAGVFFLGLKFSPYIFWVIPIVVLKMLYNWYFTKSAKYILTTQRLIRKSGIINVITFEIELYRIKDALLFEPILLRIFSLGNIYLASSQKSTHNFTIQAVSNAAQLREVIRTLVEKRRSEKGVSEFDGGIFNN
jgi:Bacterial PH domain